MSRNEILNARVQIIQAHADSAKIHCEDAINRMLSRMTEYFEPLNQLVDLGLNELIQERSHQKNIRMLCMNLDEEILNLRHLTEQEMVCALMGYKDNEFRTRAIMNEGEKAEIDRVISASQQQVQIAIEAHDQRMLELKAGSTSLISSGLDQLRELQLEEAKLEGLCERNEKKLKYLSTKNETLRAPVESLVSEVSAMKGKVSHFEKFIKPELEKLKLSSKSLKNEIRERSFLLECLTQKLLMLQDDLKADPHQKAQDMIREEALATMSLAETDVTT